MASDRTKPEQVAVPRTFKSLPDGASYEQIMQALHELGAAYATIAAGYTAQLPSLIEDHRELRVVQEAHGVRLSALEVWRSRMDEVPPLPPMRPESESTNDLSKHASKEIAEKVAAELADPATPAPSAEKVASITEDVMQAVITRLKAEQWDRLEQERKQAENDRIERLKANAKERTKAKWKIIVACALAGLS